MNIISCWFQHSTLSTHCIPWNTFSAQYITISQRLCTNQVSQKKRCFGANQRVSLQCTTINFDLMQGNSIFQSTAVQRYSVLDNSYSGVVLPAEGFNSVYCRRVGLAVQFCVCNVFNCAVFIVYCSLACSSTFPIGSLEIGTVMDGQDSITQPIILIIAIPWWW